MSVSGPIERFRGEIDDAAKALVEATARVSRQVGHSAAS
jgi:DNA-binding IclR family transcriptional regulator